MSGQLEQIDDCPVKTNVHLLDLNLDSSVTVVFSKYSNKTQVIITETGKTSVFYEVTQSQGERKVFETACIFGTEVEESLIAARIIGELLGSQNHPVVIAFGFKDLGKALTKSNVSKIVEFIETHQQHE